MDQAGCPIELGQLVMCESFRRPALLAKMAVTADGVRGGRLVLGLGAGRYDPEYLAFGFPADHRVAWVRSSAAEHVRRAAPAPCATH
jgi:alkanesulfonate monooxygenase SsuD/methylene tetrahydromethanopterin reductase-like flavin-dependent oxidoreductase (luciferase family)